LIGKNPYRQALVCQQSALVLPVMSIRGRFGDLLRSGFFGNAIIAERQYLEIG
jgi:hypothetical protein